MTLRESFIMCLPELLLIYYVSTVLYSTTRTSVSLPHKGLTTHAAPKIMSFLREKKLSPPVLRLEISSDTFVTPPISSSPSDEPSPSFRERARALSNAVLPSRRPSQNDINNTTSLLPPRSPLHVPPSGMSKARDESQKLLAHVLEQLRHRPKCPSSYPPHSHPATAAKSISPRSSTSRTNSEAQSLDTDNEDTTE